MADDADGYGRFLSGDWNGLKKVMEIHYQGLVLYLNRYLNNLPDAEDMAEETFYTLAVKRPKYTPKAEFKTWLYRVGRNITLKHVRKSRKEILFKPEDISGYMQTGEENLSELIREEEKGMLHSAMQRLKEEYRQVLLLRYFEGMTAEEIGAVMKRSNHSVNGLLKRAKAELKQEMKREGYRYERS